MKYRPTVNVWANPSSVHTMQRGQWVSAGVIAHDRMNIGRFCGVTPSGSVVVAWHGNARQTNDYNQYVKALMTYCKSRKA